MTFGLDRRPKSLGEIVGGAIADTAKVAIVSYPWYVGIVSHMKDTKFFEQAYNSLSAIAGVAIANITIQAAVYIKANYQIKKRNQKVS